MNHMQQPSTLVSSADVNGTEVYGRNGDKVGHIDHLNIDKQSGQVAYAIMNFGGFLGVGEDHYPIPWKALTYDTDKNGYVTDINEEKLKSAPERVSNWSDDRAWQERTHNHYGVAPYWMI